MAVGFVGSFIPPANSDPEGAVPAGLESSAHGAHLRKQAREDHLTNGLCAKEKDEDHPEELVIGEIFADAGPMLKRFRAAPMGRGVRVRKRMSHVTIKLYKQA